MDECVFCKIISGELPSHTVYEDDQVIAFLDISPIHEGHVVLIPKHHEEQLWDLDAQTYGHMMGALKKLALHLRDKTNCFRIGTLVEGMEVPHAHINIIPLDSGIKKTLEEHNVSEPDHEALETLATELYLM